MTRSSRRQGGRAARAEARKEQIADPRQVVRPGLAGGSYRPLSEQDMAQIYEAALDLLEDTGMGQPTQKFIEIGTAAGCTYGEDKRLKFPRALVRDVVENKAAKQFTLPGFLPEHDLEIGGDRVHFGTAGAAVQILDHDTQRYRETTLQDLYDLTRIYDKMDHVHFYLRPIVARDLGGPRELDLNTAYAVMSGTTKPVASSFFDPQHVYEVAEMADMMLGGKGRFRERPFLHAANTFVVPPMRFVEDSCDCMVAQVETGMIIMLVTASQAGATSPAALAGSLVQTLAEILAGLTMVNLMKQGHPCTLAMWPFVSDLRTGAMSGGSGEQALLSACASQILNWLDLPSASCAGMTDAKLPDNQAGYEKGTTVTLAATAGSNMIYQSASMLASILGCSKEAFVIDNDMLGMINRTVRGVEVTPETLSAETIRSVVAGEGHFLADTQTLSLMAKEYLYPALADRSSPKEWGENGFPELAPEAAKTVQRILEGPAPSHIAPEVHAEIHRKFPIRLDLSSARKTTAIL